MNTFKNEFLGWKKWEVIWLLFANIVIIALSLYWKDTLLGIISATSGCICVIATGKGKLSAYFFGLINTILYAYIAYTAKYYGEAMLNFFYYMPMQFIGFYLWQKHMNSETLEVVKIKLSLKGNLIVSILAILAIFAYGFILKLIGGNLPFIDSLSVCLSVIAMILSVKRYAEQWIIWIIIDGITIYMWVINYINGGNDIATLLMWLVYFFNAIIMFVKWYKESKNLKIE